MRPRRNNARHKHFGSFKCVDCKAEVHTWAGIYDFFDWKAKTILSSSRPARNKWSATMQQSPSSLRQPRNKWPALSPRLPSSNCGPRHRRLHHGRLPPRGVSRCRGGPNNSSCHQRRGENPVFIRQRDMSPFWVGCGSQDSCVGGFLMPTSVVVEGFGCRPMAATRLAP
jgi:hypothetical protein